MMDNDGWCTGTSMGIADLKMVMMTMMMSMSMSMMMIMMMDNDGWCIGTSTGTGMGIVAGTVALAEASAHITFKSFINKNSTRLIGGY